MTLQEETRWAQLAVRQPGDVPAATPLAWQTRKLHEHGDRLLARRLPAGYPGTADPGEAGDALAVLALGESVRRTVDHLRGVHIHEALDLGATWAEVATALDIDPAEARALLLAWADGQHQLHRSETTRGKASPMGFDDDQAAAVRALCRMADDDQAPGR